jgi:GH15 family glucan-1,4-alpha-glucosidase
MVSPAEHRRTDARGTPPSPPAGARFHVLREYALLADGERGALIDPDGAVVWMCLPRWDDDAVFSDLVGGAGHYRITPEDRYVWGGHYEPGTLIWRSRWVTNTSVIECREALAAPARSGRAVLLRRIIALEGPARLRVELCVADGYGARRMRDMSHHDDGWTAATGRVRMRWTGAPRRASKRDGTLCFVIDLSEGTTHDLVLALDTETTPGDVPAADALWSSTEAHWRATVPSFDALPARDDCRHSYAVLAGLTSSSGGMVAASTTSLPERAEAGRSYDYRYVWIRDQSYAGQAVAATGGAPLLDDAVRFVTDRLLDDGARLQPAYTVRGDRIPPQTSLHLAGYPGGDDVIGNHVREQFQLDAFGESLLLFSAAARHDRLPADGWRAAELAVDAIATRRDEADCGIWELDMRRWTHSRLACIAGLRAISQAPGAARAAAGRWSSLADSLLTETSRSCLHPSGRWQRAPDDPRTDAALLLGAIRGALPADDPRSLATHASVRDELAQDGYAYRFRHDSRPLAAAEGAFLLCGFWMALSCASLGRDVEAARWFERNRAACGPPGLYSEEFDVVQRQLRGNLPQAFVHALMLECAATLELDTGGE